MTGIDNEMESNEAPNMKALGETMSTALSKFTECKQLEVSNSEFVLEKIEEIGELGVKFQECANQSIQQSDKLSSYAEDVVVFAIACADPKFTREELLDYLKSTLESAKENKLKAQTQKTQISGIIAILTNIQNECAHYSMDIQKDARKIDSETVNQLENAESRQRLFDRVAKFGVGFAALGGLASIIAAPFTGGASLVAEAVIIFEGGLIMAGSTSAIALGSKLVSKKDGEEITALSQQLNTERDQLDTKIKLLNENLGSIISETGNVINFWEEQITFLNELVEKLDRQDDEPPSKLVSLSIQKKWNNVGRECKEYNRVMRAMLQKSNMNVSN